MKKAEERQEEGGGRKLLDTLGFNLIHFVFASIVNMFLTLVEGERLLVRYFETLFLEKKKRIVYYFEIVFVNSIFGCG
jgi:hypothetical protein